VSLADSGSPETWNSGERCGTDNNQSPPKEVNVNKKTPNGGEVIHSLHALGFYTEDINPDTIILTDGENKLTVPRGKIPGHLSNLLKAKLYDVFTEYDYEVAQFSDSAESEDYDEIVDRVSSWVRGNS